LFYLFFIFLISAGGQALWLENMLQFANSEGHEAAI
jgi:hypothetical protein